MTPEEMWDNFINRVNVVDSLGKEKVMVGRKTLVLDKHKPHKNLLGSVEHYKQVFLEANKPQG
jgi:hypothetical protein